jgi:hypothetical protein
VITLPNIYSPVIAQRRPRLHRPSISGNKTLRFVGRGVACASDKVNMSEAVDMIEMASARINAALEDVPMSSGMAAATFLPEGTIEENAIGPVELKPVEEILAGRISVPLLTKEPKAWILATICATVIGVVVFAMIKFFLGYQ